MIKESDALYPYSVLRPLQQLAFISYPSRMALFQVM
jgi:hypothetical protein